MTRFEKAFLLFDDFNKQDPNLITWDGLSYPEEYFFAIQLHKRVLKLNPNASEALLLASRSQHIGRWTSARTSYPDGKAGYLQWRLELAKFHAMKAGELMKQAGYENEMVEIVAQIIRKKDLKANNDVQTMENALCLVFLEFQFEEFLHKHDEQKVIRILQKSWAKMSQPGKDAASTIQYNEEASSLLTKALT